jgi:hypothetical protein
MCCRPLSCSSSCVFHFIGIGPMNDKECYSYQRARNSNLTYVMPTCPASSAAEPDSLSAVVMAKEFGRDCRQGVLSGVCVAPADASRLRRVESSTSPFVSNVWATVGQLVPWTNAFQMQESRAPVSAAVVLPPRGLPPREDRKGKGPAEPEMKKPGRSRIYRAFAFGGESGIRTPDLRIMIPSL